jgi:hypothetical protein
MAKTCTEAFFESISFTDKDPPHLCHTKHEFVESDVMRSYWL